MDLRYDQLDDAALIAQVLQGDSTAFGPLLLRHWPSVTRLCRRLLGPTPDAQDVAQEGAIAAFLNLRHLQDPAHFGPWLHAISANLARSALRRRRPASLDMLTEHGSLVTLWPPSPPTPEATTLAREVHDTIIAALMALSPANRDVAIGFFLDGYSYTDLAELLGIPLSTVKGRLFKGRRQLQQSLATLAPSVVTPDRRQRKELRMLSDDSDLIPVTIDAIFARLMTDQRVVVLREPGEQRYLPIWIGAFEGDAIMLALQGREPARPMTHDLMVQLLATCEAQLLRVVVNTINELTFFAEITVGLGDQTRVIDARPSDALALAIRTGTPIYVARTVFEKAGVQPGADAESTKNSGVVLLHQDANSPGGITAPPPSTFFARTLRYLADLTIQEESPRSFPLAQIDWATRFPAQDLVWQDQPIQALQLTNGDEAAWLLVPPTMWARITAIAEQAIGMERDLVAQRGLASPPRDLEPP